MKLHSLLLRQFSNPKSPRIQCLYISTVREPSISNEVLAVIETVDPMEPALEPMVPFLSAEIVTSIIQNPPNPQSGFRFFIWASNFKRFRSWKSRNLMIDLLINQNGLDLYCQVLKEIKNCRGKLPSDAFLVLMQAYLKMGFADKAVETFGSMKDFDCEPDIFAYNMILHLSLQSKLILLALAVYNRMIKFNCSPNVATFSILVGGLSKNGNTKGALYLFDEMTQRGISPNTITYTVVISGLCHSQRVDDAYRLFNTMKENGISPDHITCSTLLNGFCKLGRVDEAFALLRLFEKDGYLLGVYEYSSLIDGLFRAKRHEDVRVWYQKMIEKHIKPDVVLCTIMMKGLSEAGKVWEALKLLNEMTESGVVPDTVCYNALIKGFCDMNLLTEAQSLRLEISNHNCFPNAKTHTILICGMCRNGLVGDAQEIFNEMEKLGCYPSVVTFNALIDGLCKAGQLEKAHLLFYKMEIGRNPSLFLRLSQGTNRTLDGSSLQTMVEQLCDSGLIHKAYKILVQLADRGIAPDIYTYNILVNGFCKAGNFNGAYKLLTEMQFKGFTPDTVTYGTLISGLLKFGREDDAFKVFNQMEKNGCVPGVPVYRALMTWMCRRRKLSVASSLWLKHLSNIRSQEDETIKAVGEYFEKEEFEKAVRGLLEMDFKFNDFDLAPYAIWLIGLCKARRVEEALKIFLILKEYKVTITPPCCVKLIYFLGRGQNLEHAVDVFLYTIEKGYMLRQRVTNRLLRRLLFSEDKKNHAFLLLSRMESLGYDLDAHLYQSTKFLLRDYWNTWEMENVSPGLTMDPWKWGTGVKDFGNH